MLIMHLLRDGIDSLTLISLPLPHRQFDGIHFIHFSLGSCPGLGQIEVCPDDCEEDATSEDVSCLGTKIGSIWGHDLWHSKGGNDGSGVRPED